MSTERVDVLVVVVTYGSAALVPDLVASLPAGLAPLTWRLWFADNASADDTVAVVRAEAPGAGIVEMGRNAGYAAGINAAVAAAAREVVADAILVLNPDVRLEPGCVPALAGALADPGVGIAVPRLVDGDGRLVASMRREPSLGRALADVLVGASLAGRIGTWGEVVAPGPAYDRPGRPAWAEGSTQLVSAACWQACGGWDESFFLYSEETDFHLRAGDRGHRLAYVPTAHAVHLGGESTTSARLWSLLVANRVLLHARRHGRVRSAAFWAVVLLREASRAALGRERSRAAVRVLLDRRRMRGPRGPEWGT